MTARILIVDDEIAVCNAIGLILTHSGFKTMVATNVGEAQAMIMHSMPSLVLLDWLLNGESGLDLLWSLRKDARTRTLPVIMLTVKNGEEERIHCLERGADDYVTKPFSSLELLARIKVALRRMAPGVTTDGEIRFDELVLHPASKSIMIRDYPLRCTAMDYRLLSFFMTHPERVYYRDQLLDLVWGREVQISERTVDVHVRQLRNLLKPFGKEMLLQTVRGAGYIFSTRPHP